MPTLIMGAVPRSETAAANGFNTLVRSLGTTVGPTVIGVILTENVSSFGSSSLTSEAGFRIALVVGGSLGIVAGILGALVRALNAPKPTSEHAFDAPVNELDHVHVAVPR